MSQKPIRIQPAVPSSMPLCASLIWQPLGGVGIPEAVRATADSEQIDLEALCAELDRAGMTYSAVPLRGQGQLYHIRIGGESQIRALIAAGVDVMGIGQMVLADLMV